MAAINYGMEPDLEQQSADLQRRQLYIDQLRKQQMTQEDPNQMVSGRVVPTSIGGGLAKLLAAYMTGQQQKGLDAERKDIVTQHKERESNAYSDYLKSIAPIPADALPTDQVGPVRPERPQNINTLRAANLAAQLSPYSKVNAAGQLGAKYMEADAAREDTQAERRANLLDTHQQRLDAEQRAKDQKEADAKRDQGFRQDNIRLTRSLIPGPQPVAPSYTTVIDPADSSRMLQVDGRVYKQGTSVGAPGVVGVAGKEPTAAKKAEQLDAGRDGVSTVVAQLKDQYSKLQAGNGITDPKQGALSNLAASAASSGLGQVLGGAVGTENQSARNTIAQTRPLLMNAIKQATGMSAKQMDSNAELKLWLATATDPKLDLQANMSALKNLDKLYGLGNIFEAETKPISQSRRATDAPGVVLKFDSKGNPL